MREKEKAREEERISKFKIENINCRERVHESKGEINTNPKNSIQQKGGIPYSRKEESVQHLMHYTTTLNYHRYSRKNDMVFEVET